MSSPPIAVHPLRIGNLRRHTPLSTQPILAAKPLVLMCLLCSGIPLELFRRQKPRRRKTAAERASTLDAWMARSDENDDLIDADMAEGSGSELPDVCYQHFKDEEALVRLQNSSKLGCPLCTILLVSLGIPTQTFSRAMEKVPKLPTRLPTETGVTLHSFDEEHFIVRDESRWSLVRFSKGDRVNKEGFLLHENANDAGVFKLINQWISQCTSSHHSCTIFRLNSDPSYTPARLIKIKREEGGGKTPGLRLIENHGHVCHEYIALSHCWGNKPELVPRTTTDNIHSHLENIPFSSFTKTFQDAVETTFRLRKSYLWIDSLCIVQDDPRDVQVHCSSMSQIYSNSFCTISATGATDGSDGCFIPRHNVEMHPCVVRPVLPPKLDDEVVALPATRADNAEASTSSPTANSLFANSIWEDDFVPVSPILDEENAAPPLRTRVDTLQGPSLNDQNTAQTSGRRIIVDQLAISPGPNADRLPETQTFYPEVPSTNLRGDPKTDIPLDADSSDDDGTEPFDWADLQAAVSRNLVAFPSPQASRAESRAQSVHSSSSSSSSPSDDSDQSDELDLEDSDSVFTVLPTFREWTYSMQGPIFSRGWTLQERELSARVLHFTSDRVVWECRECYASEDDPTLKAKSMFFDAGLKFRLLDGRPRDRKQRPYDYKFSKWRELVEEYSTRSLSVRDDKLRAIAGLAEAIKSVQQDDVYLSGVWKRDLAVQLLWYALPKKDQDLRQKSETWPPAPMAEGIPSWSWAAYDGAISFDRWQGGEKRSFVAEVQQATPSYLSLTGQVVRIWLSQDENGIDSMGTQLQYREWTVNSTDDKLYVTFDANPLTPLNLELLCFILVQDEPHTSSSGNLPSYTRSASNANPQRNVTLPTWTGPRTATGLVLMRISDAASGESPNPPQSMPDVYRRVGIFNATGGLSGIFTKRVRIV